MLIREICGEMVFMTELDQLRGWYQKKMEEFGVFELHGGQAFWTGDKTKQAYGETRNLSLSQV